MKMTFRSCKRNPTWALRTCAASCRCWQAQLTRQQGSQLTSWVSCPSWKEHPCSSFYRDPWWTSTSCPFHHYCRTSWACSCLWNSWISCCCRTSAPSSSLCPKPCMESTAIPMKEVIGFNWYISKIHAAEQNVLNLNDSQAYTPGDACSEIPRGWQNCTLDRGWLADYIRSCIYWWYTHGSQDSCFG